MPEQAVAFASRDGVPLTGRLHRPAHPGPHPAVVICHPHPLMGGDMHNPVVLALTRALVGHGVAVLRFNFRRPFDQGRAEQGDVAGALDFLTDQPAIASERLAVAGYSFGAAVAAHHAPHEPRIRALALIAPPADVLEPGLLAGYTRPICIVVGDRDPISPAAAARAFASRLAAPATLHVLPGVDHFFSAGLDRMSTLVADFLIEQL